MFFQSFRQRICFHMCIIAISTLIVSSWALWMENAEHCRTHKHCLPDYFCNFPTNRCTKCVDCFELAFDDIVELCPNNQLGETCSTCRYGFFEDKNGDCTVDYRNEPPLSLYNVTGDQSNSTRRWPFGTSKSDFNAWNIFRILLSIFIIVYVYRAWIKMVLRREEELKTYYRKLRCAFLLTEEEYEQLQHPFHSSSSKIRLL